MPAIRKNRPFHRRFCPYSACAAPFSSRKKAQTSDEIGHFGKNLGFIVVFPPCLSAPPAQHRQQQKDWNLLKGLKYQPFSPFSTEIQDKRPMAERLKHFCGPCFYVYRKRFPPEGTTLQRGAFEKTPYRRKPPIGKKIKFARIFQTAHHRSLSLPPAAARGEHHGLFFAKRLFYCNILSPRKSSAAPSLPDSRLRCCGYRNASRHKPPL